MLRQAAIFYCLLFCILPAFSQNGDHKYFKKADKIFYKEHLRKALAEYHKISEIHELSEVAMYHMEICSLLTDYPSRPLEGLFKFKNGPAKKDKFYYYWLGRVYYSKYEFDKAISSWKSFQKIRVYKSQEIKDETKQFIEWAYAAKKFYQDVGQYRVRRLPTTVNSTASELSPLFIDESNEIIFVSDRNAKADKPHQSLDVFRSSRLEHSWGSARLDKNFGQFDPEHPEIEHVPGDQDLFFFKGQHRVHLFFSESVNDQWSKPVEYEEKTGIRRLEGHFFINKEHNMILYAIRKKHSPHDLDIYRIDKNNSGHWSKPALFAKEITSKEDEDYAYLTEDGQTLYFSSRGHNSIGEYDIFKSEINQSTGKWSRPERLKYPINTVDDDVQFRIDNDQTDAYFVSNRYGAVGKYDIYQFDKANVIQLTANIQDKKGNPVSEVQIKVYDEYDELIYQHLEPNEEGIVKVPIFGDSDYQFEIYQATELLLEDTITVPVESADIIKSFTVNPKRMITEEDTYEQELIDPKFEELDKIASKFRLTDRAVIRNIYFDFEKYNLKAQDKKTLSPLVTTLKENPSVNIEIGGHTDNVGAKELNLNISKLRANSVKEFLVKKGLSSDRIQAKGYGESEPLASNDDEKDGRELNRRIEIKVLN